MFTGIIETLGRVKNLDKGEGNLNITVEAGFQSELKIDQSIAHNGVCLTVAHLYDNTYTVTAIDETLKKTTLKNLNENDRINLERGMILGSRLDGHLVQGHVDTTGVCTAIDKKEGSRIYTFQHKKSSDLVTIPKGSITIDGVSLTVVDSDVETFSVAIIPYTYENTLFNSYTLGTQVNLEFDVIGKYVSRLLKKRA